VSWIQTAPGRNLLLVGAALAPPLAATAVVTLAGARLDPNLRLAILLGAAVPAFWLAARYWRGLDEAAQEAQKSAWFWGGSFGIAAGLFALLLLPPDLVALVPGHSPRAFMLRGALFPTLGAGAGFLVAWIHWWWARR
jgi:hypothetical protein